MRIIDALRTRVHREQKGQTIIFLAVMFTVLLGFTAVVSDAGVVYWNRRELQNAVDGAALAGAAKLPSDTTLAIQTAGTYAQSNNVLTSELLCDANSAAIIGCPVDKTSPNYDIRVISTYNDNDTIVVSARRHITYGLRYIFGGGDTDVAATAAAMVGPAVPHSGLLPWGVTVDSINNCGSSPCTLYYCPPNQACPTPGPSGGNFGAVDFQAGSSGGGSCSGGSGGKVYGSNIVNGYNGPVPSPIPGSTPPAWNWQICTQTGADVGNTFGSSSGGVEELFSWDANQQCDGGVNCANASPPLWTDPPAGTPVSNWGYSKFNPIKICAGPTICPRLGIVPVIQSWPGSGNKPVTVVTFACFYITDYNENCKSGQTNGCNASNPKLPEKTIQGLFTQYCTDVGGSQVVYGGPLSGPLATTMWR